MTLKVRSRGLALCPVFAALGATPRRYIGRRWDEEAHGWAPTNEDVEVHDHFAEYRQAVREGSLWAADEATAKACGVEFDPTFGGE